MKVDDRNETNVIEKEDVNDEITKGEKKEGEKVDDRNETKVMEKDDVNDEITEEEKTKVEKVENVVGENDTVENKDEKIDDENKIEMIEKEDVNDEVPKKLRERKTIRKRKTLMIPVIKKR